MVALAGCGTTGGAPDGPVVSPTGKVYDAGTPPAETRFSQTASLYLRSGRPERAAELAREGIEADPGNPIHHYLAGIAHLRLGRYEAADTLLGRAERIYPAYELEIEPEREAAWAEAFNEGAEAYADGDVEGAIDAWTAAATIYNLRPRAHRNLAELLTEEGRDDEAVPIYEDALEGLERRPATRPLDEVEVEERREEARRLEARLVGLLMALERYAAAEPLLRRQLDREPSNVRVQQDLAFALTRQDRRREAGDIYDALLGGDELEPDELSELAVLLFRTEDYGRAGEAFRRLTELRPNSRDVWYNYANALFAAEAWDALVSIGDRLLELDPLSENSGLIVARAHLETGDEEGGLRRLERVEASPVYLAGLAMRPRPGRTIVIGRVTGNEAEPGDSVRLRFTFYGDGRELGAESVTVEAPATGESRAFQVGFEGRATAYRYEPAGDPGS